MTTEQMLDGMLTHPILTAHNARGGMPPWRFQWRWWQSILITGILCATGQLSLVDTVTAAQSNERPLAGLRLLHQWLVKSSPVSFKGVQALTIFHSKVTEVWRWRLWRDSSGKT
ncbi:MAG TPA: hypothetical protein EYP10_02760, partial [Armatimonadetes bacterium]|nr:hypothetical protein [Armatimonadota bacterium]